MPSQTGDAPQFSFEQVAGNQRVRGPVSTPIDQGVALGLFDQQGAEGRRVDVNDRGAIATAPGDAVKHSESLDKFIKKLIL